jgi:Protein of unknown function (DUF4236)
MGLRFRKSFKLAPGVRLNLSGSGIGLAVGPRGASLSFGSRGTYLNAGIPGTGISARQRVGSSRAGSRDSNVDAPSEIAIKVSVSDDGTILFSDQHGQPLSDSIVRAAKRQQGDAIRQLIQSKCDAINRQIESVGEIHLSTPSPLEKPSYVSTAYEIPEPKIPELTRLGWFRSFFKSQREKVEVYNQDIIAEYNRNREAWEARNQEFLAAEQHRRALVEVGIYEKIEDMESFLENELLEIVWPRETLVSTEILEGGRVVFIDVDFPEIDEMPTKKAGIPAKGYKLSVKELSPTNIQKLYMNHVHGIAFRVIGEVFHALPKSKIVVFSGFSQRPNKATATLSDEYLLSVRVHRCLWEKVDFSHLEHIDATAALDCYELRRTMTRTGIFRPIEPYTIQDELRVAD